MNEFMDAFIFGLRTGWRVFLAPLSPRFWRAVRTRGFRAAVEDRRLPGSNQRPM